MKGLFSFFDTFFSRRQQAKSLEGLSGLERVDVQMQNLVLGEKVPGLSVIILQNGKTILKKGYGYANLEKKERINPEKTLFRIASISKCITGLAFGKAVEDGLMNWDDSFYTHVPYYPKKRHDFTLRQLASHTAGIRGYRGKEFALNHPYSIKESIKVFKEDPLEFDPGKGYLYNSFDFVLLSLAIQEASEMPFDAYVRENILNPLEMYYTTPPLLNSEITQATYYTKKTAGFKKAIEVNNTYKLGGGGYLSTCTEIARLGEAISNKELLKSETYRELLKAQTVNGESVYYGLGFQVSLDHSGRPFYGHVGNTVGAYTNFLVYPEKRTVISILINCTDPKVQPYLDEVVQEALLLNT